MKRSVFTLLLLVVSWTASAQFYELGLGAGGTLFHGDVGAVAFNAEGTSGFVPNQSYSTATLRRQFNWHWSTRFNYTRGTIGSSDSWTKDDFKLARNIEFRTAVDEFALMTEFN